MRHTLTTGLKITAILVGAVLISSSSHSKDEDKFDLKSQNQFSFDSSDWSESKDFKGVAFVYGAERWVRDPRTKKALKGDQGFCMSRGFQASGTDNQPTGIVLRDNYPDSNGTEMAWRIVVSNEDSKLFVTCFY